MTQIQEKNEFPIIIRKLRHARKEYQCRQCFKKIQKGELYESGYIQTEDMRVFPRKYCFNCSEIKN